MTYKTFTTPHMLLEKLLQRYAVPVEHEPDVRCVFLSCRLPPVATLLIREYISHAPHAQEYYPALHGERVEKMVAVVPSRL
jgi:hypothetical protein